MKRSAVNTHTYPRILHASRSAFRIFHSAVHLTTLRSWYVRRAIRRVLRRLERISPTIVDVGCGSGDHLFFAGRHSSEATCIGIDRAPDAVAICRSHSSRSGRFHFVHRDLEKMQELPTGDVYLCITVLQYLSDDAGLLVNLRRAIRDRGRLLLYVPIRNERLLPLYNRFVAGSDAAYDSVQGRRRVYGPESAPSLLVDAGFDVIRMEETYGWCGKLAYETHSILLHGLTHPRLRVRMAAVAAGLPLFPLILVLMALDYFLPVERGNGLLIEARARRATSREARRGGNISRTAA